MKMEIFDCGGRGYELPQALSWDICHGFGSPCDSFRVSAVFSPEMGEVLPRTTDFKAEYEGRRVFTGRVDEVRMAASERGKLAIIGGRGLQALLLDNEAESAEYFNADLNYVLSRHARSQGITKMDAAGAAGTAARYSVESGMSHWGVISDFAGFCCGVKPRFDREGALILDGERGGKIYEIDGKTPILAMEYREDRYGVIGSVKVKKYSRGGEITVDNPEFQALGGRCHRVINVPKKTGYDAMRYTGKYQIDRSMEAYRLCTLRLPELFAAFPGDRLDIKESPLGITGSFLVVESRCHADEKGGYTELNCRKI